MESVTHIDLLRHGACEGGEIFRGSTDVALSELGWQQMRDGVARVPDAKDWQQIVCSDLKRCQSFAEVLASERGIPLSVDPALRELNFGDWEGRLLSDVQRDDAENWQRFWDEIGTARPPGGESMQEVADRVVPALKQLIKDHRGEHILMVAHGAVNRVLACYLLNMPLSAAARLSHPYAGLIRFQIHHGRAEQPDWPLLVGVEG